MARPVATRLGLLIGLALSSTTAQATPVIASVVNAASGSARLARASLATITGSGFTLGTSAAASVMPLPTSLAGVSVKVGGLDAALVFVSPTRITIQLPYRSLAGTSVTVVVTSNGSASAPFSVPLADYALGLFTYPRTASENDPILVHASTGQLVSPSSPAQPSETVIAYGTGIGKLNSVPALGTPASQGCTAWDPATVTIGGKPATVSFAGLSPGSVGVAQLSVQVPADIASGSQPLVIQFAGDTSLTVNLPVQASYAELTVSTGHLSFGNITVGQTGDVNLKLSSTGNANLTIQSLTVSGPGFSLVSPAGSFTLAPGQEQTATLRFTASTPGWQTGTLAIASNDKVDPTTNLALRAVALPAGANVGLFMTSQGADWTDYDHANDISIDYSTHAFSLVIPSTKNWFLLDHFTSPEYSPHNNWVFTQDSQVYQIVMWDPYSSPPLGCDVKRVDPVTRQFTNLDGIGPGCLLTSLGFVGDAMYFRVPSWSDILGTYGGEFKVQRAGETDATVLLQRGDPDNQAFLNAADHGTLYAVYYTTAGHLTVHTRNLTTGRRETLLLSADVNTANYTLHSVKINDGKLYLATTRKSDSALQFISVDLLPSTVGPTWKLLDPYPASELTFGWLWNVDHDVIAFAFNTPTVDHGIGVLNIPEKSTQLYDVGKNTDYYSLAPLWILSN